MNVLLFGAGAIGVFFASRLAKAGAHISVAARSDHEAVSAQGGYRIQSLLGDYFFKPDVLLRSAREYVGKADLVLVCSKVLPGVPVIEEIRHAIGSHTTIMLIQNGLDVEVALREAFPDNDIISAIAYIGVSRPVPGSLLHEGAGRLIFGSYPNGISPMAEKLSEMWRMTGVPCDLSDDIVRVRFRKLLWNAPFNTVSVLGGGLKTNEMTDRGPVEELCRAIMREVCAVAAACGKALPENLVDENIEYTRNFPPYKSSMLQDYECGRELEVDAILGVLLQKAAKYGIAVPHIQSCYALLRSVNQKHMEQKKR